MVSQGTFVVFKNKMCLIIYSDFNYVLFRVARFGFGFGFGFDFDIDFVGDGKRGWGVGV